MHILLQVLNSQWGGYNGPGRTYVNIQILVFVVTVFAQDRNNMITEAKEKASRMHAEAII